MKFHYLARGIILDKGKVLLAHQKGAEHTFLPGGHIELGLPLQGKRLQGDGAVGAADQHVRADAGANRRLCGRADIMARQRTKPAITRGVNRPDHLAAGGGP